MVKVIDDWQNCESKCNLPMYRTFILQKKYSTKKINMDRKDKKVAE
jgi:hypothetical protein